MSISSLQAQWQEQLDINFSAYFKRIHFIDENYGWAQATGPYFYTTDGGENWHQKYSSMGNDIVFVNTNTGFLAANNGIIRKTIDGGNTWIDITTPTPYDIEKLFFIDENNGWALGCDEGKVLHTSDSGDTWEFQQVFDINNGNVSTIFFIDSSTGWAGGTGSEHAKINQTINGGNSWDNIYYYAYPLLFNDIYFINPLKGWVVGETNSGYPMIMYTIDGGENWSWDVELPELDKYGSSSADSVGVIYSIQFINETDGWLTCAGLEGHGYILITTDGGVTWQQQYACLFPILDICIIDENHAWATGGDFVHFNSDIYYIPIGVDEYFTQNIKISPNPFQNIIKIENKDNISIDNITITDSLGRICYHTENLITEQIDLNFLQNGIYYLKIKTPNGFVVKKIVKE